MVCAILVVNVDVVFIFEGAVLLKVVLQNHFLLADGHEALHKADIVVLPGRRDGLVYGKVGLLATTIALSLLPGARE